MRLVLPCDESNLIRGGAENRSSEEYSGRYGAEKGLLC